MDRQIHEVLLERTDKLMRERYLSKKDMAERLDMEYLTFWRKLRGKRGIDVVLLMKMADVLGTSASYLLGETNDSSPVNTSDMAVVIRSNDPSRKITSEPGTLNFNDGEFSINIPDTPSNKKWFDNFLANVVYANRHRQTNDLARTVANGDFVRT